MRIIFMGSPAFAVPTLDALVASGHEVAAVYCQPPRPAHRGKKLQPSPVQREAEIRQMLEARSARRVRRGGEPLDVDAEFAALTRGALDPGIAVEVRQLVEARNARRVRQGKEPLDVEAEVARRLRELAD